MSRRLSVDAVCDIDPHRASMTADEYGIGTSTTDLDELLALHLDIVGICTPSALYFQQAETGLRAGRNVVV